MTAPYSILIAPRACSQLLDFSPKYQKRLLHFFSTLAVNPRPLGVKRIEGLIGLHVQHIDEFRVIYKILENELIVLLIK